MKRKITIEIENGANVEEFFDKVQKALGFVFARNLDALHDVLSEYGDGMAFTIRQGDQVKADVKRVFSDLQKELSDFSVVFEAGNFNTKAAKEHEDTKVFSAMPDRPGEPKTDLAQGGH